MQNVQKPSPATPSSVLILKPTSMNNGVSIDGVTNEVTITASNNEFKLSNTPVQREGWKNEISAVLAMPFT